MTLLTLQQLKTRIVVTIIVIIAMITGILIADIYKQRNTIISTAERHTAGYAKALCEHAERTFAETERVTRDILHDITVSGGIEKLGERELYDLMKMQSEGAPQIGDIFAVDKNGTMFNNTNSFPPKHIDVSDRDYFKFYASTPGAGITLGTPVKSRLVGRWRFNLMRPLAKPGEPFDGLLAIAFEVEYFRRFFDSNSLGKSGKIMLIHENGKPLVYEPYFENAYSADFTASKLFKEILPRNLDYGSYRVEKGIVDSTSRIASYKRLSRYPVYAVVSVDVDEALAVWRSQTIIESVLVFILSLVIAILGKVIFVYINRLNNSQTSLLAQQESLAIKALQVDMARDAILLIDKEGKIVDCNPALADMTGYPLHELKGKKLQEIEPPEYAENVSTNIETLIGTGEATFESGYLKKNGETVLTEVHARLCKTGEETSIVSVVRDIRDRKLLKKREETRLKILEKMTANAPLKDLLSMIVNFVEEQAPGALCSVLLADNQKHILRHGAAVSLPEEYNRAVDGLRIANKMGSCGTAAFTKQRVIVDDISTHPFWKGFKPAFDAGLRSCWSEPVLDSDGEILGTFAIYRKNPGIPTSEEINLIEVAANLANLAISLVRGKEEQERLHEQLRHIQKIDAIGQLAGGIAHDLNNLLTPILVYGDMIKSKLAPEDSNNKRVDGIMLAANKARDLNQKLLSFSRKQILTLETINLNHLINDFSDVFKRAIPENIILEITTDSNSLFIYADRGQLEQTILNLVVNARDAITVNGSISIHTSRVIIDDESMRQYPGIKADTYVLLKISDNGCGMDEEVCKRVFEPFFTTKEAGKGTGFGLAMAYGIIKQHNGYIVLKSTPGEGTTFFIYLPAVNETVAIPTRQIQSETTPEVRNGVSILLVEDDEMVRQMAAELLSDNGYTVYLAPLPTIAIALLQEHPEISLLLSDVVMPEMNGQALYEELKKQRPDLPAIFISGYTDNVVLHNGEPKEGVNFINKPFTSRQLLDTVHSVTENRVSG